MVEGGRGRMTKMCDQPRRERKERKKENGYLDESDIVTSVKNAILVLSLPSFTFLPLLSMLSSCLTCA